MKNKLLLSIICMFCIAAECCKEKDRPTYYMPQDFKDYIFFPQGSYWIYEDSVTNDIDSLYLIKYEITIEETDELSYNYEALAHRFFSSKKAYISAVASRTDEYYEYFAYYQKFAYYFDISSGQTYGTAGTYYAKYDSLLVKDIWYKNVVCIKEHRNYNLYHYWVKHIGLVKSINDANNTVWELKSYHINN